jgi:hypothetical protein
MSLGLNVIECLRSLEVFSTRLRNSLAHTLSAYVRAESDENAVLCSFCSRRGRALKRPARHLLGMNGEARRAATLAVHGHIAAARRSRIGKARVSWRSVGRHYKEIASQHVLELPRPRLEFAVIALVPGQLGSRPIAVVMEKVGVVFPKEAIETCAIRALFGGRFLSGFGVA